MSTTQISRHIQAPRDGVYQALVDAEAIARWKVPDGMSSLVHEFEAREGGHFRVSLTYDAPDALGKSSAHTDTYHGHFVKLVPGELVIEAMEFETTNPAMGGEMRVTYTLLEAPGGGTDLHALHENVPSGVAPADNELGWRMSLGKLASFLEEQ